MDLNESQVLRRPACVKGWSSVATAFMLFLFVGCVAHEKNGDAAAAIGDWRTALAEYREALQKEPDSPVLREKYQRARDEAIAGGLRKGRACSASEDWSCALKQADYVLRIDDGNAEATMLRADATKGLARKWIAMSRSETARREFRAAWADLQRAQEASSDADLAAEFRAATAELAAASADEGERLLLTRSYADAVALFEIAAQLDPAKVPRLEVARAEYERFRQEEYDRLAMRGDAAMQARRWSEAAEEYRSALEMKPGGRAEPLLGYCRSMGQAESAIAARNFSTATGALRSALQTGQDRGDAAQMLDAVEVRAYAVRVRSLMVKPERPGGGPWVGKPSPLFGKLVELAAHAVVPGAGGVIAGKLASQMAMEAPANMPTMTIDVTTPDGRRLATAPKRALYSTYESRFVIASNHFDDRRLTFRVVGEGVDAGAIDIRLSDLVSGKPVPNADGSIIALDVAAERADHEVDGMATGLVVLADPTNETTTPSLATPMAAGFKLTSVEAQAVLGDYQNEFNMDGPPDLVVEIEQAGKTVYRSPKAQDQSRAQWTPGPVYLFVEPSELLIVRIWDSDVSDSDLIFAAQLPSSQLGRGEATFSTKRNSWVRLRFEPRDVGPR